MFTKYDKAFASALGAAIVGLVGVFWVGATPEQIAAAETVLVPIIAFMVPNRR